MTRKPKKLGLESSATRTLLLDTAEQLMREEGYAAVTSRRLGDKAGVKPPLIHYYFEDMDDLFVTLYERRAERNLKLFAEALRSGDVPQIIWEQSTDPAEVALNLEFMALANHRKVVRTVALKYGDRLRRQRQKALRDYFEREGVDSPLSPNLIVFLMASVGFLLAVQAQAGTGFAHAEVKALVAASLRELKSRKAASRKKQSRSRESRS